MIARIARVGARAATAAARPRAAVAARSFGSSDGKIPEDINQQHGRRLAEMKRGAADNVKKWHAGSGKFMRNLSGQRAST